MPQLPMRAKAQVKWGATNPQRRARVMMAFVRLINRDMEKHGAGFVRPSTAKTFPDAKGDHPARAGSDRVLHRRAASAQGRVHRQRRPPASTCTPCASRSASRLHHALQLPRHDPLVGDGPGARLRQCDDPSKPSERDPSVPLMLAELMQEAGLPDGVLQVVSGDKEARSTRSLITRSSLPYRLWPARPRSPSTSMNAAPRSGQARAVLWRRQEPHDHHARCRHGSCR